MSKRVSVLRGNLDVMVLKALSTGRKHGFEIASWIESGTGGVLEFLDSALYQSLYRLEARGLVDAEFGITSSHRSARYYSITASGRRYLKAQIQDWHAYARAVSTFLGD